MTLLKINFEHRMIFTAIGKRGEENFMFGIYAKLLVTANDRFRYFCDCQAKRSLEHRLC